MIDISNLEFEYGDADFRLRIPQFSVAVGEKVAIVGPSGSGKTTLLMLIAGVQVAERGAIRVGDRSVAKMDDAERRSFRISNIGFVFQEFELLDYLTVRENILLPFLINDDLKIDANVQAAADQLAESMGIADKLSRHPKRLSQGERQRAAICRALITRPRVLLADEPTGSLDPVATDQIVQLLLVRASEIHATVLLVTHDHRLLGQFDRTIDLVECQAAGAPAEAS